MEFTEQHVSDEKLSRMIILAEEAGFLALCNNADNVKKALLELKQRRAEDRQRKAEKDV